LAELAKAKKHFAEQKSLMLHHYTAVYAAFRKSFPVEQCWPGLEEK
jgi:hypothetical protein